VAQYKPHKTTYNEANTANVLHREFGQNASAGPNKDAALVSRAFSTVKGNLRHIQWFHTDRGSEFKNDKMDELLETFDIGRSLSKEGFPYDNAVAAATTKS
jgi:putative transposase